MPKLNLRFQKYDKFQNPVFIASKGQIEEKEAYDKLKDYYDKLEEKDFGTFLPIYHSSEHNYSTIRFKKNEKYNKMTVRNIYAVDFTTKQLVKDSKIYVNCFISSLKLVCKASALDDGEELDLE